MYSDAVNILSCLWVRQHLYREGEEYWGKGATEPGPARLEGSGRHQGTREWAAG